MYVSFVDAKHLWHNQMMNLIYGFHAKSFTQKKLVWELNSKSLHGFVKRKKNIFNLMISYFHGNWILASE